MTELKACREAFEDWCMREGYDTSSRSTARMYIGWQAAWNTSTPQSAPDRQKALDIIDRLRGKVRVPIADGLGKVTPDGNDDFFERTFPTSKLANEAADFIKAALTTPAPQSCDCDAPTNAPEVMTVEEAAHAWFNGRIEVAERFSDELPNGLKIVKENVK